MTFSALHKRVTYVFAGLGFAALALGTEFGRGALVLCLVGATASWFAEGARVRSDAWARSLTVVVFAGLAFQVVRALAGADILATGLEYAGFLQVTRLFHRRSATEHLHVVGIGVLHLLAGTLLSTGLDYALVFIAFVVVTPWMLALTHLRSEIERQHLGTDGSGHVRPSDEAQLRVARLLESENLASRGFLLASSLLSLPLFAVTAAFFLVFPRVGLGVFTFGEGERDQVAGFGDHIDLGQFGTIRDDPSVVARVYLPAPRPGQSLESSIRLRGTSFDRYDGVVWSRTASEGQRRIGGFVAVRLNRVTNAVRRRARQVRVVVEPMDDPVVFLPSGTFEVRIGSRIENGLDIPRAVVVRPGLDVRFTETEAIASDYVAIADPATKGFDEPFDDAMRARLLHVPPAQTRVAELAETLAPPDADDYVVAERIETYLRDSGAFGYSLTREDPRGRDPLVHFLFHSRSGHCELFATAMAVMLRARGIPARNVTGFYGGRWNAYGRYYALRNGDAHSWVEAYVDGTWQTFDPTPAGRDDLGPVASMFTPVREWIDAMRVRWSRDVVGYDMQRQIALALELRDYLRALRGREGGRTLRAWEDEPAQTTGPSSRGAPLGALALVALVALVALGAVFAWRARRTRTSGDAGTQLYRELDRALGRHGLPRPASRTPLEHLAFVRASGFAAVESVAWITAVHERVRYGGGRVTEAERAEARSRIAAVRRGR